MGNRLLLDCTLRDGGYVNDWEFGHDKIVEIFERLVSSGVNAIEIGFLDDRRKFDINRTIMPNTEAINKIFAGLDKGNALVVAMIDYGTCKLGNIQPCEDTFIDGIRVIFKEHLMYEALAYCKELKKMGYKVFAQMVSVTTYTDEKLKEYAELVNSVKPYANSMVDTYGLLHQDQLMHIFHKLDEYLDPEIIMGFHAHNNFQLGYANCIEYLTSATKRTILADGTLYGMGKLHCLYNHHEQASAMAGEAYARLKNKMAAVCVTSGPGAINALNGVAGAYQDSIPMLVFSGQTKTTLTVKYSGLNLRTLGNQEFDIVSALDNMTKYAEMVMDPMKIRYCLEKAYHIATTGRPGPCWLDIPLDVQGAFVEEDALIGYTEGDNIDKKDLEKIVKQVALKLERAKRPVIYGGTGIRLSGGVALLHELAKKYSIPVVTCWDSIDLISTDNKYYCGRAGTMPQ